MVTSVRKLSGAARFWMREPGADDELPASGMPELRHVPDDPLAMTAAHLARLALDATSSRQG
jgi:hypothetical protein